MLKCLFKKSICPICGEENHLKYIYIDKNKIYHISCYFSKFINIIQSTINESSETNNPFPPRSAKSMVSLSKSQNVSKSKYIKPSTSHTDLPIYDDLDDISL
jgi:hypothetical protein